MNEIGIEGRGPGPCRGKHTGQIYQTANCLSLSFSLTHAHTHIHSERDRHTLIHTHTHCYCEPTGSAPGRGVYCYRIKRRVTFRVGIVIGSDSRVRLIRNYLEISNTSSAKEFGQGGRFARADEQSMR